MILNMLLYIFIINVVPRRTEVFYTDSIYDSDVTTIKKNKNPKFNFGVTLSGGGVKGICHLGVLKALDERGVKPDIISGASFGAIVGAFYADGYSPDSILSLFKNVSYYDLMSFDLLEGGLFNMDNFHAFLEKNLRAKTFEDLKIPLRVVATDFDMGKTVVFDSGNLADALCASSSVPMLFTPYKIDGINYVDGGVLLNMPVVTIRSDCKYVLGVSGGPMEQLPYSKNLLSIGMRAYKYIYRNNAKYNKSLCDYLIEPAELNNYSGASIESMNSLYKIGYDYGKALVFDKNQKK